MIQQNILITGATGHLGTEIVLQLLNMCEGKVFVLVRANSHVQATNRLRALWWEEKMLCDAVGTRVLPVPGDITREGLGICLEDVALLRSTGVSGVVHCAAETRIMKSREELWQINVRGTENAIAFAQHIGGNTCRFAHISTAYVAGATSGTVMEDAPLTHKFNSLYEESKAEAERIVRQSDLQWLILRPGMIVGNSTTGRTRNFNTVYYVLKLILQGKMRVLPVSPHQTVNIVPADYVARTSVQLLLSDETVGKTFHLTLPHEQLPCVGELLSATQKWAKENLGTDIRRPLCVPVPILSMLGGAFNHRDSRKRGFLSNLLALMPYFYDRHRFDRSTTDRYSTAAEGHWQEWFPAMLTFACRHNFMQLTPRSIFEQAMVRRAGKHYPITYYNIGSDAIREMTGKEMNDRVEDIVRVLRHLHVKAGDRIAVTGINCTEQVAIDCAIGLIGAVSVPIYYTAPAAEAADLIARSGSSLFLVGDKRMTEQLASVTLDIPVITFANADDTPEYQTLQSLIDSSSADSASSGEETMAVEASALATIRYTSGTTGTPKGVMFSFSQLKWMGEVLANLLPWQNRNTEMRYLSFLPTSHVVEGILATYAPYCMLCKVKLYYLNDFSMLTKALPKVRPTVFFSVPRFYEKLWEQIEHNPLGRLYLRMSEGCIRRLLGKLLRKAVLRKAGLDRCSQLIVGSAPMSEELLLRFRHLGIEIHNAYGQTEAPLITINRLGDNVVPSIGTPLPDTTVTVGDDGELIVRGPQVAMGYYNLRSDTFRDGALYTGDLGRTDIDGHIYIHGRKKDMLITSYGKNINCSKIEQLLTDINHVTHAVLVGEQRPYCCALLWAEGDTGHLQEEIDRMNSMLSHPEQVKRWCVVSQPLSIANGELTPNLKVRRNVVWTHFAKEINGLYE